MGVGWVRPKNPEGFGRWLIATREARGMSVHLVAVLTLIPLQTLLNLERATGHSALLPRDMKALARTLGVRYVVLEAELRRPA